MDPLRLLTADSGFFTRQEALSAGHAGYDIARNVRTGTWIRFRRGAYAFADEWRPLSLVGRHQVRTNAVMRSLGDAVALSHVSGCIRHGIDVWGIPLDRVHVTRLDGGPGRIEGDVVHHEGLTLSHDLMRLGDHQVLAPDRCVLEAGSRSTNEAALCLMESGLRSRQYDGDALSRRFEQMQSWPFMRHLQVPVRMADPRAGSVGESRGNWMFWTLGVPRPHSQFEILHPNGELAGISDWAWPDHRLLGEFDGRIKYGRLLKPGQDPGDAVFEEKRREDLLRELSGYGMIRFVWSDYADLGGCRSRLDRALRRVG
ncbi:type IV toxin-antitoxin system AbiEi family antitoxin domain-containing protein [Nocardioides humilatus]|uniref:Type IV toxin-antitoxin system AbiEi family antitoxin domain-containing protein n=1 Tax=Nocardioides humilatus TaxID=2607660 RepID=A0A5B1LAU5_9ACTN|nr:type IV toxin-antitoxin system AbiEi family antitoxin domain-containing protein [Nocardioides humilatus]KAA1417782.1 type IV toxin-antitoxin system AbiEi family antitoxin domain-containing protein [Nocardioides humilatus]